MNYSQLRIKNIPGIFPTAGFSDLKIIDQRIEKLPDAQKDEFITEKKYKTIDFPNHSRALKIQSILRNKYQLQLIVSENTNIDLSKISDNIEITFFDNSKLNVFVLSIDYERQQNTSNYKVTIVFVSFDDDDVSISNYLLSDNILELHNESDLHRLTFFSNKTISSEFTELGNYYTIHTKIIPTYFSTELQEKKTGQSGIEYVSNSIDLKTLNLLFYLSEDEAIITNRYMPRCECAYNLITGVGTCSTSLSNIRVQFDSDIELNIGQYIRIGNEIRQIESKVGEGLYQMTEAYEGTYSSYAWSYCDIIAEERIIPAMADKGMVTLYECNVNLKYNKIDFDNYD